MLRFPSYQGNTNKSHSEVLPNSSKIDLPLKIYKQHLLTKMWGERYPTQMWECSLVQPLWKSVWSMLKQMKIDLASST